MDLKCLEPEDMPTDERKTHIPYEREYKCPGCFNWRPMIRRGHKPPCGRTSLCEPPAPPEPAPPLKEWTGRC